MASLLTSIPVASLLRILVGMPLIAVLLGGPPADLLRPTSNLAAAQVSYGCCTSKSACRARAASIAASRMCATITDRTDAAPI
jgi:hypothetical protein